MGGGTKFFWWGGMATFHFAWGERNHWCPAFPPIKKTPVRVSCFTQMSSKFRATQNPGSFWQNPGSFLRVQWARKWQKSNIDFPIVNQIGKLWNSAKVTILSNGTRILSSVKFGRHLCEAGHPSVHELIKVNRENKVKSRERGVPAFDNMLGVEIGQIRRTLSTDFVRANSVCLLSQLSYFGKNGEKPGQRRTQMVFQDS